MKRCWCILVVVFKYQLQELYPVWYTAWLRFFRRRPKEAIEVRLRQALEELGPIFVKFGQLLSLRHDLLPATWVSELSKLRDQVPAVDTVVITDHMQAVLGCPLSAVFSDFSKECIASASVAQVHRAVLNSGEVVAVKVLKPGIKGIMLSDVAWMAIVARVFDWCFDTEDRIRTRDLVEEFREGILTEVDLQIEAANMMQIRRNFEGSSMLKVPKVFWDYVRPTMIVMEYIEGIAIDDMEALRASGADLERLAKNGVEIFFTQVLRDRLFHADMHPGNLFVDVTRPEYPVYAAVDFGIVGLISEEDQYYLARNFLAFFSRDYVAIAELHIHSGWVPDTVSVEKFTAAIRSVCEPIFSKPLKDISFALLLLRLLEVAGRFHLRVQPQLMLLQKTLYSIESLGRRLHPELNLWQTAQPVIEKWMQEKFGWQSFFKRCQHHVPEYITFLPSFPHRLGKLFNQLEHDCALRRQVQPPKRSIPYSMISGIVIGIGLAMLYLG